MSYIMQLSEIMEISERVSRYQFKDFIRDLSITLNKNNCSDVTLVCDDQSRISANKVILSSFSPLLKNILLDIPDGETIVRIEGVHYQEVELLLKFLYTGEGILSQKQLNDVLHVAKELGINKFELMPNYDKMKSIFGHTGEIIEYFPPDGNENESEIGDAEERKSFAAKCEECDKGFKSKSGRDNHVMAQHQGIRPYHCPYCEYKASFISTLEVHIQSVHVGIKYPCDLCDYKAPQKRLLKRHEDTVHKLGERVNCRYCPKTFSLEQSLQRHVQEVHAKKKLQCSLCDFVAQRLNQLQTHVRQDHLGEDGPIENIGKEKTEINVTDFAKTMNDIMDGRCQMSSDKAENGKRKRGRPKGSFGKKRQMFEKDVLPLKIFNHDKQEIDLGFLGKNKKDYYQIKTINGQFQPIHNQIQAKCDQFNQEQVQFEPEHHKFHPDEDKFQPNEYIFQPDHDKLNQDLDSSKPNDHKFKKDNRQFQPDDEQFQPDHYNFQPDNEQFPPDHYKFQPDNDQFQPDHDQFQPDSDSDIFKPDPVKEMKAEGNTNINHSQKVGDDNDISGLQVERKNTEANRADSSANIINPSKLLEDYYDEANDSDYADQGLYIG